jgi:hypothetical protein
VQSETNLIKDSTPPHYVPCCSIKGEDSRGAPREVCLRGYGWTEGTEHYIGVSASYNRVQNGKDVAVQTLLSMQPLLANGIEGMTAGDHIAHISKVLQRNDKKCSNVLLLCGDNCNVNGKIASTIEVPLLGCGSHKINLAVCQWIEDQPQLIQALSSVSKVMKKASSLKLLAKLRQYTTYNVVKENDRRWSSTVQMLDRYLKIQTQLSQVAELLAYLPTHIELDVLTRAYVTLTKFDAATISLQKEGITFVTVREMFDVIIKDYPEFEKSKMRKLLTARCFEKTVMKIAKGLSLAEEEELLARPLVKTEQVQTAANSVRASLNDDDNEITANYALALEQRLKRQKREGVERDVYVNLDTLLGTSVMCERLFSLAKFALTDTRKRTLPALFEALMLLKVNRALWDVFLVGKAMGKTVFPQEQADDDDDSEADFEEDYFF